jgi:hypothetical protein
VGTTQYKLEGRRDGDSSIVPAGSSAVSSHLWTEGGGYSQTQQRERALLGVARARQAELRNLL